VQREKINVGELLATVREYYDATAADAGVSLINADSGGPLTAELDRSLMLRAVSNLLSNAIAHTPPGGTVKLSAQAMAPYSDDIQSPDWLRDYPSNGGDALAYQEKGHLWDAAAKAGVSVKNCGEYVEYNTFTPPCCTLPSSCKSDR
jgi:signal transduction histidine kinase